MPAIAIDRPDDVTSGLNVHHAQRPLQQISLGLLRIGFGWALFWSGIDKIFGLGFATTPEQSVLAGISPTKGFLSFGLPEGAPAAALLKPLAGHPVADALFLLATVGAGLALLLGIGTRVASIGGGVLMLNLWFASLPLEYNPFLDQHLFYAIAALSVLAFDSGRYLGLGNAWRRLALVRANRWLI
ncbi:MAG: DoxX family protein [Micropruina sp.]|uniref:DoxX family protein n=1 Tax=Micropruina sp. TaxID=2737536 RepID=UPI0039E3FBF0